MMASGTIREEPFAVINADDFYGEDAYRTIADYLRSVAGQKNHYCMVGYEIRNTLSDFGAVSRVRRGPQRQPDFDGRAYAHRATYGPHRL